MDSMNKNNKDSFSSSILFGTGGVTTTQVDYIHNDRRIVSDNMSDIISRDVSL